MFIHSISNEIKKIFITLQILEAILYEHKSFTLILSPS
jgi:hypothetical protein